MAITIKAIHNTTVEMNGSQENTGSLIINEVASEFIWSGSGLKVRIKGEI